MKRFLKKITLIIGGIVILMLLAGMLVYAGPTLEYNRLQ